MGKTRRGQKKDKPVEEPADETFVVKVEKKDPEPEEEEDTPPIDDLEEDGTYKGKGKPGKMKEDEEEKLSEIKKPVYMPDSSMEEIGELVDKPGEMLTEGSEEELIDEENSFEEEEQMEEEEEVEEESEEEDQEMKPVQKAQASKAQSSKAKKQPKLILEEDSAGESEGEDPKNPVIQKGNFSRIQSNKAKKLPKQNILSDEEELNEESEEESDEEETRVGQKIQASKAQSNKAGKRRLKENSLSDEDEDDDSVKASARGPEKPNLAKVMKAKGRNKKTESVSNYKNSNAPKKTLEMLDVILTGLTNLDTKNGVSVQALKKHIMDGATDEKAWKRLHPTVKAALEHGIEQNLFHRPKGKENVHALLIGSFKINKANLKLKEAEGNKEAKTSKIKESLKEPRLLIKDVAKVENASKTAAKKPPLKETAKKKIAVKNSAEHSEEDFEEEIPKKRTAAGRPPKQSVADEKKTEAKKRGQKNPPKEQPNVSAKKLRTRK